MSDMIQTAAFLVRNLSKLRNSIRGRKKRQNFLMWLAWNYSRFNACAVERDGKLIAVGVARSINNKEEARHPYANDENGKLLYVEHVAAKTNEGFLSLLQYVQKRWPNCSKICFSRSKSGSKLKMYNMNDFIRKAGL